MTQSRKIDLDPTPFDDEERETMEALDKAFDDGTLVSDQTDERRAAIEASARVTMNPPKAQITTRLAKQDLSRSSGRSFSSLNRQTSPRSLPLTL